MNATDRRLKIFNIIVEEGSVNVSVLSKIFNVTPMTIRRDLSFFENKSIVTTNYGGAVLNKGSAIEPSFYLKSSQMTEGKKKIGEAATYLLQNGDSVFFDCGTTVVHVVKNLPNLKITAITNSLPVCNILKAYPNIKLICVGGIYNEISDGFTGNAVTESLKIFNIDKAIIGSQGFDIDRGATVPDENDAFLKKAIMGSARTRILVVGHEKIGVKYLTNFADPADFDYIVTDKPVDEHIMEKLRLHDISLIVSDNLCTLHSHGESKIKPKFLNVKGH